MAEVVVEGEGGGELSAAETTVGQVYSVPWDTPIETLYSRQESFDRYATDLNDVGAFLPVTGLRELAGQGRIGAVTPHFHNINRGYSQTLMMETAAPLALERCRAEAADVAILTPV